MARATQTPVMGRSLTRVTPPPRVARVFFVEIGGVGAMARSTQMPVERSFFVEIGGVGAMARGATLPDGIIFIARDALHSVFDQIEK